MSMMCSASYFYGEILLFFTICASCAKASIYSNSTAIDTTYNMTTRSLFSSSSTISMQSGSSNLTSFMIKSPSVSSANFFETSTLPSPTNTVISTPPPPDKNDFPLNTYLAYGGAGGLGFIIILIIIASILCAIVGAQRKQRMVSLKDGSENILHQRNFNAATSNPALIDITDEPDSEIDFGEAMQGREVYVNQFSDYMVQMCANANSGFEEDFDEIARITRRKPLYTISKQEENDLKNRFDNIYPYDSSRVILSMVDDVQGSDYINASYIDGYDRENAYIATQGPLPKTIGDFWRMVWEFKLTTVIMLTEVVEAGKDKCTRYWPITVNSPCDVGYSLMVTLIEQIPLAEYQVNVMKVANKMDPESCVPLVVTQFHYSSWPDHGVPVDKTSLISFIHRIRRHQPYYNSPPLLVHCSAGVGRTGTFITLDSMIQRMKREDALNIFEFICQMRSRRPRMVQTEEQYVFIHEALEEFITCGDTSIGVTNLRIALTKLNKNSSNLSGKTLIEEQFAVLDGVSNKPTPVNCTEGNKPYNVKKNRYQDRIPYNNSRVYLKQSAIKGSDYINASYIDGYKQQKAFIATHAPLRSTVNDFWRMIWECQSRALVVLSSNEEEDDMFTFWPKEENSITVYGKVKVKLLSEEQLGDLTMRKLELREDTLYHVPGVVNYFVVTQLHHTKWLSTQVPTPESVLKTINIMQKVQRSTGNHSITILCNDGMGRTGTFICVCSQLEKMKTESVCDVFQFVKAMRLQRPWMVENVEQFSFCYTVITKYLDTFEHYANFK